MRQAGSDLLVEPPRTRTPDRAATGVTVLVFAGLSLACAALSEGFVTADACTHLLYAKYAWVDPVNLVDVWARPFCTALWAVPAYLGGRLGVRVTSLLVALGCGWVSYGIARGQRYERPGLALLFTLGGPLLFVHSFSTMTELPFALLLGAAFWAFQNKRWFWAALLVGLTPTARPEGFGFVLLAFVALVLYRRWLTLVVLPLPLLAWDLAGWLLTARPVPWWRWLAHAWPWSAQSLYGRGNLLSFVAVLPIVVSPLVLPAMLIGIVRSVRGAASPGKPGESAHLRLCRWLTAAIPLFVLTVHSLLRWLGKLGSFGEPRYLLVVAPFWGVLSAAGWEWIGRRFGIKHPWRWAAAAVLLPIVINLFYQVVPIRLAPDFVAAKRFADWYHHNPARHSYPNVIASHPGIFYFLDENPTGAARRGGFTRSLIDHPPTGTLLVWDPIYSDRNANIEDTTTLDAIRRAGWISDRRVDELLNGTNRPASSAGAWHVFRSGGNGGD